jgi:hypothetical protein
MLTSAAKPLQGQMHERFTGTEVNDKVVMKFSCLVNDGDGRFWRMSDHSRIRIVKSPSGRHCHSTLRGWQEEFGGNG